MAAPLELDRAGHCPETHLWRCVIRQAKFDLMGRSADTRGPDQVAKVRAWVRSGDFVTCCLLASIDPGYARREFEEWL